MAHETERVRPGLRAAVVDTRGGTAGAPAAGLRARRRPLVAALPLAVLLTGLVVGLAHLGLRAVGPTFLAGQPAVRTFGEAVYERSPVRSAAWEGPGAARAEARHGLLQALAVLSFPLLLLLARRPGGVERAGEAAAAAPDRVAAEEAAALMRAQVAALGEAQAALEERLPRLERVAEAVARAQVAADGETATAGLVDLVAGIGAAVLAWSRVVALRAEALARPRPADGAGYRVEWPETSVLEAFGAGAAAERLRRLAGRGLELAGDVRRHPAAAVAWARGWSGPAGTAARERLGEAAVALREGEPGVADLRRALRELEHVVAG